ncbi:hypothetical protein AJ87_18495 [Rhizobium yanglingense]|nr:hypothetical protein AJ87_18495 [Rhizobium yanglingense]
MQSCRAFGCSLGRAIELALSEGISRHPGELLIGLAKIARASRFCSAPSLAKLDFTVTDKISG